MRCLVTTLGAALGGGLAAGAAMALTFRMLGFETGWLLDPATQSAKLIAVWTTLHPLPRIVTEPLSMQAGLILLAGLHAAVYRSVSPAWPPGIAARGLRFAGLLTATAYLFWEFFTPFNLFGEPLPLVALETGFWALVALAESFAIAWIVETRARPAPSGS